MMSLIFEFIAPVIGIIVGLLIVIFPRKITQLQIKQASKSNDWLNRQVKEGLSKPSQPIVAVVVGLAMITICVYMLMDFFHLI